MAILYVTVITKGKKKFKKQKWLKIYMKNQKLDKISLAHAWENLKQPEEVDVY